MNRVVGGLAIASALILARFFLFAPVAVRAEPLAQTTATPRVTDEPTKSPYVFPTPIFIPTFPPDTAAPTATRVTPPAGATTYVVEPGDNPSLIAKKVYGDAGKFRLIVEANNLTDATRLRAGQILIIPPLTPVATASPTFTPTIVPATPTLFFTPTAFFAPTVTAIPSVTQTAPDPTQLAINLFAVILLFASIGSGILAYQVYRRNQQFDLRRARPLSIPPPLPPEKLK